MHVPTDTLAMLSQNVAIPALADMPSPALSLWHRMKTYDVLWGCSYPDRLYDSLDITIRDVASGVEALVVRQGNRDCVAYNAYLDEHGIPPLTDIQAISVVDLTPFAGRTVVIEMSVANRRDWSFNTWAYIDAVQVINQPVRLHGVYLPSIVVDHSLASPRLTTTPAPIVGGRDTRR
jgi:hypothetical protein